MLGGEGSILSVSPSFNSYSSTRFAEIAAKVSHEFSDQREELGLEEDFLDGKSNKISSDPISTEEKNGDGVGNEIDGDGVGDEIDGGDDNDAENDTDSDDEFEFAVVSNDREWSPISADEIFYNGQIKPIYPVFNRNLLFAGTPGGDEGEDGIKVENPSNLRFPLRKLLIAEREGDPPSSSSSEADELETLPEGTFCVWTPKPVVQGERCKKSNSTGSSKRWRFRDFLHRSNSDGKDTFVFLAPSAAAANSKGKKKEEKSENAEKATEDSKERRKSTEMKVAGKGKRVSGEGSSPSAHEIHYIRNRAVKEGDRRRSYLPYRQDLVGLFANVNGLSRNLHPF